MGKSKTREFARRFAAAESDAYRRAGSDFTIEAVSKSVEVRELRVTFGKGGKPKFETASYERRTVLSLPRVRFLEV